MSDEVFRLFNEGVSRSLNAHQHRQCGRMPEAVKSDREAIAAFDQALELDSRHTGALGGKGMSLAMLGMTREAAACFQQTIELEPDSAENHRQLGLCFLELGELSSARGATLRALELEPGDEFRRAAAVEIYNFGGSTMMRAAEHREAGRRDEQQGCYARARDVFSLALEVDDSLEPAREALRIVDSCLREAERAPFNHPPDSTRGSERPGFWQRLFRRK